MWRLAKRLDCGGFSAAVTCGQTAPINRRSPNTPHCHLPISSRSAKIHQVRGQPCPRVSSSRPAARGQGCPRSFGCGFAALRLGTTAGSRPLYDLWNGSSIRCTLPRHPVLRMPSVKRIFRETTLLERRYGPIQGFDSTSVPVSIARIGDGNLIRFGDGSD